MSSSTVYQRVDLERLREAPALAAAAERTRAGVRLIVIPISIVFCAAQSVLTLIASNVNGRTITDTMIPVLAMVLLFVTVLTVNPLLRQGRGRAMVTGAISLVFGWLLSWYFAHAVLLEQLPDGASALLDSLSYLPGVIGVIAILLALLRLCGFRPFNRAELTCVFAAMMVTAGVSTFGLTEQLIPLIATPFNPEWNTPDRGWGDPLILRLRPELYIHNAETIALFRRGMPAPANIGWLAYLRHCESVFFKIPWGEWMRPLGYWLVFVAGCYSLFYCLAYVVLGYWADREKLIFPLAKLLGIAPPR